MQAEVALAEAGDAFGIAARMRLGLFALNYGTCANPEAAVTVAKHAEAAGFESVWTGEHVVLPDPQPSSFSMAPTLPFLDTTVALTLLATATTRMKLASGIILLPLRNPVVLAKQLASLDVVSGGRLIVGVGAGYVEAEFAAAGVPLAERAGRMDDGIRALRALWTMEHPRHRGHFSSFDGVDAHPRPVQRRGPPIVVGGEARAALARAVTMADGWYGFYLDLAETRSCLEGLRRAAEVHERQAELGRLELTVTPRGVFDRDAIERYSELGIDRLVLLPQPNAEPGERHRAVPLKRIRRNIDDAAAAMGT
jgi:probable F420-dependent oxidoreductase